jgi:four helix bundle protein
VLSTYKVSKGFPKEETYGLTAQLRRAAVSVPANIAEGFKRRGRPDKARLMNVAEGSLEEARYYLRLAKDLGYTSNTSLNADAAEVGRLLGAYARSLLSPAS